MQNKLDKRRINVVMRKATERFWVDGSCSSSESAFWISVRKKCFIVQSLKCIKQAEFIPSNIVLRSLHFGS